MKIRYLLIIFIFVFIIAKTDNVYAKAYFTTKNGYSLTKEEYDNLSSVFSPTTISILSNEALDLLKNDHTLSKKEDTKYYRFDEWKDNLGNVILSTNIEVDKETAETFHNDFDRSGSDTHTTSMKSLTLQVVQNDQSVRVATLTNTWLSIPSTKSFDVIGLRINNTASYLTLSSISGVQIHDGITINYYGNGSNTKTSNSKHVGISMNIVNNVTNSLQNQLTVVYLAAQGLDAYGAYQHAKSDVTLSQSQNYSFSANGKGGVFKFANSVNPKYDDMQGVHVNF
ncbi:MAG: hypothetical protein IKX00_04125 [Bacilli bacterium]|nr:hypothetical protein [Bacilli bacterium]